MKMKGYNIGLSVLLIAISVYIIKTASGYNEAVSGTAMGPGVWPIILAGFMIVLSAILLVRSTFTKSGADDGNGNESPKVIDFTSAGMKRIYIALGILIVFAVLLKLCGFYVSIAFLLPAILVLFGERRAWVILLLTVAVLLFIYLVFVLFLNIRLPRGSLTKF